MNSNNTHKNKPNILIVDDNLDNLRLLIKILKTLGYLIRPVKNGQAALNSAFFDLPDLILLDIMMPDQNGFDVCRQFKADKRTRSIPIIFISALDNVSDKVKAFACGGVDYISKPFQEEEVLARVKTHLKLHDLQKRLENKNKQLQKALDQVKLLSGIIPICASCKKIRDDQGYWNQIEAYIEKHSDALFSHAICPECTENLYGKYFTKQQDENET